MACTNAERNGGYDVFVCPLAKTKKNLRGFGCRETQNPRLLVKSFGNPSIKEL